MERLLAGITLIQASSTAISAINSTICAGEKENNSYIPISWGGFVEFTQKNNANLPKIAGRGRALVLSDAGMWQSESGWWCRGDSTKTLSAAAVDQQRKQLAMKQFSIAEYAISKERVGA